MEEAEDEATKKFWADRIKRKYGIIEEIVEEVEEKPKAKKKKEDKE